MVRCIYVFIPFVHMCIVYIHVHYKTQSEFKYYDLYMSIVNCKLNIIVLLLFSKLRGIRKCILIYSLNKINELFQYVENFLSEEQHEF